MLAEICERDGMKNKELGQARAVLDRATGEGDLRVAVGLVADSQGVLLQHASGYKDQNKVVPMQSDSIFAIASMTKLVTTIAALQLDEKRQLNLDETLDVYLPEIKEIQIMGGFDEKDNPLYATATRAPTVRELITHTSGYVYSIWNEQAQMAQSKGLTNPLGAGRSSIDAPLFFEPGSRWEYGIGTDWLGVLIEKVSGESLMDYFEHHIFSPLGMVDSFYEYPDEKMDRSVRMSARLEGELIESELYQPEAVPPGSIDFYSGGGGLYSTVADYSRVMRALLNGGALDGQRILSEAMVEQMFENQIGDLDVSPARAQVNALSNDFDMGFGAKAKWGLGFLISPDGTENGRSPESVSWAGLFNSYFWIDRERDLCAVFATQVLPFYDEKSVRWLKSFERAVYGISS